MEFKVVQKELELKSRGWIPTFHDVSKEVLEIVKESGVKNGTVCVASHHTTCSVMIQEASHDLDSFDLEYLQHDLDAYKEGLKNSSSLLDCLWGELYGSINAAEISEGTITPEHADYLRRKYLWGAEENEHD